MDAKEAVARKIAEVASDVGIDSVATLTVHDSNGKEKPDADNNVVIIDDNKHNRMEEVSKIAISNGIPIIIDDNIDDNKHDEVPLSQVLPPMGYRMIINQGEYVVMYVNRGQNRFNLTPVTNEPLLAVDDTFMLNVSKYRVTYVSPKKNQFSCSPM